MTRNARRSSHAPIGRFEKVPITAVVLCHNEEHDLGRCLRSLTWVEDVLVIDDRSVDGTVTIAQDFGRVLQHPLDSFDAQRNFALSQARHEWTLFVDADEVVSSELAAEIAREVAAPRADAYTLVRRNWFLGRQMRFGGWQNDKLVRLGRTSKGRWVNPVHEVWRFDNPTVTLKGSLDHYTDSRYAERLTKSNQYTTIVATELFDARVRASAWTLLFRPSWKAAKSYLLKQGFRDGLHGLIWAGHVFVANFATEVKLIELQAGVFRRESE